MLRPWIPLVCLVLLVALGAAWGGLPIRLLGGALLALALLSEFGARLRGAWDTWRAGSKRRDALRKARQLDWSVIDRSLDAGRSQRDCERPETLGICTGLDCLVYASCRFNIKKKVY